MSLTPPKLSRRPSWILQAILGLEQVTGDPLDEEKVNDKIKAEKNSDIVISQEQNECN